MKITARLLIIRPSLYGSSNKGLWERQEIVVEFGDGFQKKLLVFITNRDLVKKSQLVVGCLMKIDFEVRSWMRDGRWYSDVIAQEIDFIHLDSSDSDNKA